MQKKTFNVTIEKDLIEYINDYAHDQNTSVSEVFKQFILTLKHIRENDPTDIILSDAPFKETMLQTIDNLQSGNIKWHTYDEVLN